MKQILQDNRWFFYFFATWLLVIGYFLITFEKGDALLFFNQQHSPFWNTFFTYVTKLGEEGIYIVTILSCLFIRFRYSILFLLTGGFVAVLSFLAKQFFKYDRPFTFFDKQGIIEKIDFIDGLYILKGTTSFPSGHTMSAFAVYGLVVLLLPIAYKRWASIPLLLIAMLVGISRVYLVHHFLMDICLGSILGVLVAILVYYFQKKVAIRETRLIDGNLKQVLN
ncbi:MAG: membrane-associated phospholipid phosphatase [Paraglaciecola sp.]|jgi:membrane-associated phospholipid phosphatase